MASYRKKYGIDFPAEFSDTLIDLTVAKKWRLYESVGVKPKVNPGDCLEQALKVLFPSLRMSPWTRTMVHDFVEHDYYAMIGCGACGKSHAMSACGIAMWMVDPYHTAVVIGSATLKDLAHRAWSPTLSLFSELKASYGAPIPGKIVHNAYAILNEKDEKVSESETARASIQGHALDEGRLQGLHVPWVYVMVDELALVRDIEALKMSLSNVRIGTLGFKFVSAANPDSWESPNSCFYIPKKGQVVDENTGCWESAMGYFVRHFNGYKSPVVLDPSLKADYPFLISQEDIKENLNMCNGDATHPMIYKMVVGFPRPSGGGIPTVLDPVVAAQNRITAPLDRPMAGGKTRIGLAAGIDPAWSEGGDEAIYAGCEVVEQDSRVVLDFSNRVFRLPLSVANPDPVTKQLRDGVIARANTDGGPLVDKMYVDSSGNQGLADDLDIYVGPGCGHVNSSARASDYPLRALDPRRACEHIKDRGAEAWLVLAEFCRAGQVRGLPQGAADALVQRRFATRPKSNEPMAPLRLEAKDEFIRRFKGSPNEADACALAALAVKERLGVTPFGGAPAPEASAVIPAAYGAGAAEPYTPPDLSSDYGSDGCSGLSSYS